MVETEVITFPNRTYKIEFMKLNLQNEWVVLNVWMIETEVITFPNVIYKIVLNKLNDELCVRQVELTKTNESS